MSFDFAHPDSLVSAQWVADRLTDPDLRVAEVIWGDSENWGTAAYGSGHIPGAVSWDFATDLQDPARNDIADQAGLRDGFSRRLPEIQNLNLQIHPPAGFLDLGELDLLRAGPGLRHNTMLLLEVVQDRSSCFPFGHAKIVD